LQAIFPTEVEGFRTLFPIRNLYVTRVKIVDIRKFSSNRMSVCASLVLRQELGADCTCGIPRL